MYRSPCPHQQIKTHPVVFSIHPKGNKMLLATQRLKLLKFHKNGAICEITGLLLCKEGLSFYTALFLQSLHFFLGCQRKLFPPTPTWWLRLCSGLLYISTPLNFFSIGALGLPMRGMSNNTPQLNRSLSQGTQLPSHVTPTTGVPTMSLHTPPSPSRYLLIANVSAIVSFCRALIKCSAYCASATLVWLNKNI